MVEFIHRITGYPKRRCGKYASHLDFFCLSRCKRNIYLSMLQNRSERFIFKINYHL